MSDHNKSHNEQWKLDAESAEYRLSLVVDISDARLRELAEAERETYRNSTQVTGYCPICAERAKQEQQEPKPRDWTPCDEGSPSKNDFYQTTERTRLGEIIRNVRHYGARGWQIKWGCGITVIAWQPLPAAWKEPENV